MGQLSYFEMELALREEIDQKISELNKQVDFLKEQIKQLEKQRREVLNISFFDRNMSFQVITHLVSLMENKEYLLQEKKIGFFYDCGFNEYTGTHDYYPACCILSYLVEKDKVLEASQELERRFPAQPNSDYLGQDCSEKSQAYDRWKQKSIENSRYNLSMPSDTYIQLAYCTREHVDRPIVYDDGYSFDPKELSFDFPQIHSKICDRQYSYIVDFMKFVVENKTAKPNYEITFSEMLNLVNSYVESYRKSK